MTEPIEPAGATATDDASVSYRAAWACDARLGLARDLVVTRADGEQWELWAPAQGGRCRAPAGAVATLLSRCAVPTSVRALDPVPPDAEPSTAGAMLARLLDAGVLTRHDDASVDDEGLPAWDAHDRLFHVASRRGRDSALRGRRPDAPTHTETPRWRPRAGGARVALPGRQAVALDQPLDAALRARRTRYGVAAPPLAAVGALLGHVFGPIIEDGRAHRAYPSGGNLHALQPFVCVCDHAELPDGAHLYDPPSGELVQCAGRTRALELLLEEAGIGIGYAETPPRLVLVLAASYGTVSARYAGIAYSLLLKEVGAAMMTLSLVASALGLACAPVGTGNSHLFAAASDTDRWILPSVGELVVAAAA